MSAILRIALDTPLRQLFDYRSPPDVEPAAFLPGARVRVPFGKRRLIGVLIAVAERSEVPLQKLKFALEVLDTAPVLDDALMGLVTWAADYYHHPAGEALAAALPKSVRAGKSLEPKSAMAATQNLAKKSGKKKIPPDKGSDTGAETETAPARQPSGAAPPTLTPAQSAALEVLSAGHDRFACYLLHGVTGSGKTEVYLRFIEQTLALGRQALVLTPEIGLTPQLVGRIRERFNVPLAVLHSGLTDKQRFDAWGLARSGAAPIVVGTRSAVFTPLPRLGAIIVDEEHDASYKQQEGFRYSARDLAIVRAQRQSVPVVLGSATPSLETLDNARAGRYRTLSLPERPGEARHPQLRVVDLRKHAVEAGLAGPVLVGIDRHLKDGGQVLVYLNRRGYAPTLFCPGCNWIAPCPQCDARLTVHLGARHLRCHHCGTEQTLPFGCPICGHEVRAVGQGTERVEESLRSRFASVPLLRFDRDSVRQRGEREAILEQAASGTARILVGTQMLTKGHDFPDVTLVVIVNADQGLFSADYRASERLAQTIVQVAGRAGRASKPGEVLIQTEFPDHPLLKSLLTSGYEKFAEVALEERVAAHWPPFVRLAVLRAESPQPRGAMEFLESAASLAAPVAADTQVLGPVPATMVRRAGHHRAQLLLQNRSRADLHRFLSAWLPQVDALQHERSLRWSLDVDPADLY